MYVVKPLASLIPDAADEIERRQYLGEEGSQCILKAAVVCSNPWNLEVASVALHRTWLGREVYSRVMTGNLKALVEM